MFKSFKPTISILFLLASIGLINTPIVSAQNIAAFNKTILLEQSVKLSSDTINTKTIRVSFPAGFKTPWHTHEGPGPRYVIKGKLQVVEGGKMTIYSGGDVFWESGSLMSVENIGDDVAELIIIELTPAK